MSRIYLISRYESCVLFGFPNFNHSNTICCKLEVNFINSNSNPNLELIQLGPNY